MLASSSVDQDKCDDDGDGNQSEGVVPKVLVEKRRQH